MRLRIRRLIMQHPVDLRDIVHLDQADRQDVHRLAASRRQAADGKSFQDSHADPLAGTDHQRN